MAAPAPKPKEPPREDEAAGEPAAKPPRDPRRAGRKAGGRRPPSFVEVWGRWYPLTKVVFSVSWVEGTDSADVDVFGEAVGRDPAGLALEGLRVDGAQALADLSGCAVIDAPEDDLLTIGGGCGSDAGIEAEADEETADEAEADEAEADEAEADEERGVLADDADEDDLDALLADGADDGSGTAERAVYVPGVRIELTRLRLEIGSFGAGQVRLLLHGEGDAYGEEGLVDEIDVPVYAELLAQVHEV